MLFCSVLDFIGRILFVIEAPRFGVVLGTYRYLRLVFVGGLRAVVWWRLWVAWLWMVGRRAVMRLGWISWLQFILWFVGWSWVINWARLVGRGTVSGCVVNTGAVTYGWGAPEAEAHMRTLLSEYNCQEG